jgi:hypothetical protein
MISERQKEAALRNPFPSNINDYGFDGVAAFAGALPDGLRRYRDKIGHRVRANW